MTLLFSDIPGLEFIGIEYERVLCDNEDNIVNYVETKRHQGLDSELRRDLVVSFFGYSDEWNFKAETSFLFIRLFDKYLSLKKYEFLPCSKQVKRQYIIAAAAALLLASKFNVPST